MKVAGEFFFFFFLALAQCNPMIVYMPSSGANLNYSIPVTISFEQATGKNVLLLPMGSSTDAAHSINEKLDRRNYIEGTKLLGAYLHYVSEEPMV